MLKYFMINYSFLTQDFSMTFNFHDENKNWSVSNELKFTAFWKK